MRWLGAVDVGTATQNALVKSSIMGGDEVDTVKPVSDVVPDFAEVWFVLKVIPGNAVDVGEADVLLGRTDQAIFCTDNFLPFHTHQPDGAGRTGIVSGCFEINRQIRCADFPAFGQQPVFLCSVLQVHAARSLPYDVGNVIFQSLQKRDLMRNFPMMRTGSILLLVLLAGCAGGVPGAEAADTSVLVAYWSRTGHTELMAKAVAEGARTVSDTAVTVARVEDITAEMLRAANAVIVGTPVHNASVTPEVQSFINGWPIKDMRDKVGAAFVTAGGPSTGEELARLSILQSMMVFGMIIVGGPDWRTAFGASAIGEDPLLGAYPEDAPRGAAWEKGEVDEFYLGQGRALGQRVAEVTQRLSHE